MRVASITLLLLALTGCAHTVKDVAVTANTVERIRYFTTPQGEQYVRELIHHNALSR